MKKYVKSDYSDLDRLDSINYQSEKELESIRHDITVAVKEILRKYMNHFGVKVTNPTKIPDDISILQNYYNTLDNLEDAVVDYIVDVCKL